MISFEDCDLKVVQIDVTTPDGLTTRFALYVRLRQAPHYGILAFRQVTDESVKGFPWSVEHEGLYYVPLGVFVAGAWYSPCGDPYCDAFESEESSWVRTAVEQAYGEAVRRIAENQ